MPRFFITSIDNDERHNQLLPRAMRTEDPPLLDSITLLCLYSVHSASQSSSGAVLLLIIWMSMEEEDDNDGGVSVPF